MGLLAGLAYLALALIILQSALKHRQTGWVAGVIFGLGLLSLPLSAMGLAAHVDDAARREVVRSFWRKA